MGPHGSRRVHEAFNEARRSLMYLGEHVHVSAATRDECLALAKKLDAEHHEYTAWMQDKWDKALG